MIHPLLHLEGLLTPLPFRTTPALSELLDYLESLMDMQVLHPQQREDHRLDPEHFMKTVMAVHDIVTVKLYKVRHPNLEAYFREQLKISRAQVYRFFNCARLLKDLEHFPSRPTRERICRSINHVAKTKEDKCLLWSRVLQSVNGNARFVSSTIVNKCWLELASSTDSISNSDDTTPTSIRSPSPVSLPAPKDFSLQSVHIEEEPAARLLHHLASRYDQMKVERTDQGETHSLNELAASLILLGSRPPCPLQQMPIPEQDRKQKIFIRIKSEHVVRCMEEKKERSPHLNLILNT